jgi:hypothetical protein
MLIIKTINFLIFDHQNTKQILKDGVDDKKIN